jgi:uncharacterized protein (UPF0335 family)
MTRDETIALWQRCESARAAVLAEGRSGDEAHEAAKSVWNAWANAHLRGIREELQKTNARLERVEQRMDRIERDHGSALTKIIDAVTELAKTGANHTALLMEHSKKLDVIQGTQVVIEKDMRAIRGRIERIEDHIGLVPV